MRIESSSSSWLFHGRAFTIIFLNEPGHRPTSSKMCYQAISRTSDWRQRETGRNAGKGNRVVFFGRENRAESSGDSDFGTMLGCVGVADLKRR